jgi:SNF2 family DNA or RNA helicase
MHNMPNKGDRLMTKFEVAPKFAKIDEVMKAYTNVMVLLLRLRQGESTTESTTLPFCILMVCEACNHPSLISKDYITDREAIESRPARKDDQEDEELTVQRCSSISWFPRAKNACSAKTSINSLFRLAFRIYQRHLVQSLTAENTTKDGDHCNDCIELARKVRRKSQALNKDSNLPPDSAKIRKLLELLKLRTQRSTGAKTIVFSQFTSMLDLIQPSSKTQESHLCDVSCSCSWVFKSRRH